jgi:nucleoside-diphosphate-sugar epimerase
MKYKILVTGGAGYLGSTMVPELLADGHEVTVIDNFMYKQSSLNAVCNNPNFKIIKGTALIDKIHHLILHKIFRIIIYSIALEILSYENIGMSSFLEKSKETINRCMDGFYRYICKRTDIQVLVDS